MNSSRIVAKTNKEVFIGIDVHRQSYYVTVCIEGELEKKFNMVSSPEELVKYLRRNFKGSRIRTAYEASFSGFVLHRELERHGIENIVVNPASVEQCARDRVKTDRLDSAKLALQLYRGQLKGIRVPDVEQEYRRQITRTREQLVKRRRQIMMMIRMKLLQFGYIDREYTKRLSSKFVNDLIKEQSISGELKIALESLIRIWQGIDAELRMLSRELKKQTENCPYFEIYTSIPGIGKLTARILANELGDMSQFPNERALFSYLGLTPCESSSGDRIRKGRISRQGSSRIRAALIQCAWVAISKDLYFRKFYRNIAARSNGKKAIVATARKMIGIARALIRKNEKYELKIESTKKAA